MATGLLFARQFGRLLYNLDHTVWTIQNLRMSLLLFSFTIFSSNHDIDVVEGENFVNSFVALLINSNKTIDQLVSRFKHNRLSKHPAVQTIAKIKLVISIEVVHGSMPPWLALSMHAASGRQQNR